MNSREEKIINHEFFKDRKDLATMLIQFEKEGKGFLPNSPRRVEIPPSAIKFGNKRVVLGRIDKYYYFGIEVEKDVWKYNAFEDEGMCNYFFHTIPDIDSQTLAFWQYQVHRLSNEF